MQIDAFEADKKAYLASVYDSGGYRRVSVVVDSRCSLARASYTRDVLLVSRVHFCPLRSGVFFDSPIFGSLSSLFVDETRLVRGVDSTTSREGASVVLAQRARPPAVVLTTLILRK
jgi:hypothetical protein